jgi:protein-disulfide isomerase
VKINSYVIRVATLALGLAVGRAAVMHGSTQDALIPREQADAILNELRQIRQLLEKQALPAAPTTAARGKLKIDGGYSLGAENAPLTMVEFGDYECPFCRQFQTTTFEEIRKKYIDTGKVRFISRNLPIDGHPNAMPAAQAALCAGDQGQFWKMHDLLYANKLTQADILADAHSLHVDMPAFQDCLDSGKHQPDIAKDLQDASLLQINGTPSFLVGKTTPDGVNGYVLIGALPFAVFEAKLKESEAAQ